MQRVAVPIPVERVSRVAVRRRSVAAVAAPAEEAEHHAPLRVEEASHHVLEPHHHGGRSVGCGGTVRLPLADGDGAVSYRVLFIIARGGQGMVGDDVRGLRLGVGRPTPPHQNPAARPFPAREGGELGSGLFSPSWLGKGGGGLGLCCSPAAPGPSRRGSGPFSGRLRTPLTTHVVGAGLRLAGVRAEFRQVERLHPAALEQTVEVGRHAGHEQLPEQVGELHQPRPRLLVGRDRQVRLAGEHLRARPVSTACGPTSTNTRAPASYIAAISSANFTGETRCSASCRAMAAGSVPCGAAVVFEKTGVCRRGELVAARAGGQRFLRTGDERRVEAARHGDSRARMPATCNFSVAAFSPSSVPASTVWCGELWFATHTSAMPSSTGTMASGVASAAIIPPGEPRPRRGSPGRAGATGESGRLR